MKLLKRAALPRGIQCQLCAIPADGHGAAHAIFCASKQCVESTVNAACASNDRALAGMRATLERAFKDIEANTASKLDQIRHIVDEKLQATLEQRLGESFKRVSERLEQVHRGLGEMQTLADG